jgi:hypothetical protein
MLENRSFDDMLDTFAALSSTSVLRLVRPGGLRAAWDQSNIWVTRHPKCSLPSDAFEVHARVEPYPHPGKPRTNDFKKEFPRYLARV